MILWLKYKKLNLILTTLFAIVMLTLLFTMIGSFICSSGKIRVTDPCYDRKMADSDSFPVAGVVDNVESGLWNAQVNVVQEGFSQGRNANLQIWKDGSDINMFMEDDWDKLPFEVGVDSGQAGFFEDNEYPESTGEYGDDSFYNSCCDVTCDAERAGPVHINNKDVGVVSSSGWGDGCYGCYAHYNNNNKIDGLWIQFITPEYEEVIMKVMERQFGENYDDSDDSDDSDDGEDNDNEEISNR